MRGKLFSYFVEMAPAKTTNDPKTRYFGPFDDHLAAEGFALTKPNETLDNYIYTVKEMTGAEYF